MELLYIWINRDKNGVFREQGINFNNKCQFNFNGNTLSYEIEDDYLEDVDFYKSNIEGKGVSQVTAFVGENGVGKTTLLNQIFACGVINHNTGDFKGKYPEWETVQVFRFGKVIKVYSNLVEKIEVKQISDNELNTKIKIEQFLLSESKLGNDTYKEFYGNGDLARINKIYLSNSSYFNNVDLMKKDYIVKAALNDSTMRTFAREFYNANNYGSSNSEKNKNFNMINGVLREKKGAEYMQQFMDIMFFKSINDNKELEKFSFFRGFNVDFSTIIDEFDAKNVEQNIANWNVEVNKIINSAKMNKDLTIIQKKIYPDFNALQIIVKAYYYVLEKKLEKNDNPNSWINKLKMNLFIELFLVFDCDWKMNIVENFEFDLERVISSLASIKKEVNSKDIISYYLRGAERINELEKLIDDKDNTIISLSASSDKLVSFFEFMEEEIKSPNSFISKYMVVSNNTYSSGERSYLNLFSRLYCCTYFKSLFSFIEIEISNKLLLLVDEIDLYMHPEWQRKIINNLVKDINSFFIDKSIHLIFTTHSPITLSDMPKQSVVQLQREVNEENIETGNIIVDFSQKDTFGANIFDLYNDSFFLEDTMGEFARTKINSAIKEVGDILTDKRYKLSEGIAWNRELAVAYNRYVESKRVVKMIGEPILRNSLQRMIDEIECVDLDKIGLEKLQMLQKRIENKISMEKLRQSNKNSKGDN